MNVDSCTRFNLSLNESSGEASLQAATQWAIYFYLQLIPRVWEYDEYVRTIMESTDFQFNALMVSSISSLISITMGQWKVRTFRFCVYHSLSLKGKELLYQEASSGKQQICYLFAATGKSI